MAFQVLVQVLCKDTQGHVHDLFMEVSHVKVLAILSFQVARGRRGNDGYFS